MAEIGEDRGWTPENVQQLQQLIREKVPASMISLRLRRSQEDVHAKASELGMTISPE